MFDFIPLWLFFFLAVALVLAAIQTGYLFARRRLRRLDGAAEDGPVGSVVGAVLGLLAFFLAFTFGSASSRYDERKHLLIDEVNAIGTAFLRTDLLPEPKRAECKDLLRRYVEERARLPDDKEELAKAVLSAAKLQDELWQLAMKLPTTALHPSLMALFVNSLNEVFDVHSSRVVVGLQHRIPNTIWFGLLGVAVLAMSTVGYQFGLKGRPNLHVFFLLGLSFSAAVVLIADLDRVSEGTMRVSQQPMIDLHQQLGPPRR